MICLWYAKYIHGIYLAYSWHIIIKKVLNIPICTRLGVSKGNHWDLYIHGIYMVYTVTSTYSRNIHYIYHVYTWYIHGYTIYIMCISSTWRLMLRRRTGSHSTSSTSNDIAWTNHNFNLSLFLQTVGILAPGEVDAQGAPGAVNSLKCSHCSAWQARPWVMVSVDLGLHCHRVIFN